MYKRCRKCHELYPSNIQYFPPRKINKGGLYSYCRNCHNNDMKQHRLKKDFYFKHSTHNKTYYSKNKDRISIRIKKHKYGLSEEQQTDLYKKQNGCCAICHIPVPFNKIHIDHSHVTGVVRGMLCNNCNLGLGYFSDSKEKLSNAIGFLSELDK